MLRGKSEVSDERHQLQAWVGWAEKPWKKRIEWCRAKPQHVIYKPEANPKLFRQRKMQHGKL